MAGSGYDVGKHLVFQSADAVLQNQLALLQPLDLQMIGATGSVKGLDGRIEIAMFLAQLGELVANVLIIVGRRWGHQGKPADTRRTRRRAAKRAPA